MGMDTRKHYDPRMHSVGHILEQTMVRMFHCGRCFNSHIEKKKSKLDFYFDRSLEEKEIRELENRVNSIIQANLPVSEEMTLREEALRHYDLNRLPEDSGDRIRIVKIGDYDACPCIGLHVSSTKEIDSFKIVSTNFEEGVLRIRYKIGNSNHNGR